MLRITFYLYFILICGTIFPQVNSSSDYISKYDLSFDGREEKQDRYYWTDNPAYEFLFLRLGITDPSRPMLARVFKESNPYTNRLKTEMYNKILLPNTKQKELTFTLKCKGLNIEKAYITLDGIDSKEQVLFSESFDYVPKERLDSISHTVNLTEGVSLLNVKLGALGKENKRSHIAYHSFIISIGDSLIESYPIPEFTLPKLSDKEVRKSVTLLNSTKNFYKIKEIKGKKIIGLGESVHGSRSIRAKVRELALEAVKREKCRLIIFENEISGSLKLNRYIQDESFHLDTITMLIYNDDIHLLNELRSFNKGRKDKVFLLGMDYNYEYTFTNSAHQIFDFVYQVNQKEKNIYLDKLCLYLISGNWYDAIPYIKDNRKELRKLLTDYELDLILHSLSQSNSIERDIVKRQTLRDSIMAVNTQYFVDKFSKDKSPVIVYGHSSHINPISISMPPHIPLGKYLYDIYKEDYIPISLLIDDEEEILAYNHITDGIDYKRAMISPKESLEFFLKGLDIKESFYFSMTPDFDRLILGRSKGNAHISMEFFPFNMYRRFKGVVFVKSLETKNYVREDKKSNEIMGKSVSIFKRRQERFDEINYRLYGDSYKPYKLYPFLKRINLKQ